MTDMIPDGLDDRKLLLAYYDSARSELIERIKLRDTCLIAYIASAGAYFEFFIKGNIILAAATSFKDLLMQAGVILVFPIISLVFTFIILQHHMMIGKIGEYLRTYVKGQIQHWDYYYASWVDKRYLSARTFGQGILLLIPMGYTAAFGINALPRVISSPSSLSIVIVVLLFDAAVLVWIIWLHVWAYRVRIQTDQV